METKQSAQFPLDYGKLAPGFELTATDGQTYTRAQFRGHNGLVLIFIKPTSDAETLLTQINQDQAEYKELNARVFGIAAPTPTELVAIERRLELSFVLLSDPQNETWKKYS